MRKKIKNTKNLTLVLLIISILFARCSSSEMNNDDDTSKYIINNEEPAKWVNNKQWQWVEAYPLGNGIVGAMVYGHVNLERVMLTHTRHWWKYSTPVIPDVSHSLEKVRKLIDQGNYADADKVYMNELGKAGYNPQLGSPLPIGDILIKSNTENYSQYRRQLNLASGEALTTWSSENIQYKRRYFVSRAPESIDVTFVEITSDKAKKLNVSVSIDLHDTTTIGQLSASIFKASTIAKDNNTLFYSATNPDCDKDKKDFGAVLKVVTCDGTITANSKWLDISNASKLVIAVKPFYYDDKIIALEKLNNDMLGFTGDYNDYFNPSAKVHSQLFHAAAIDLQAHEEERKLSNETLVKLAHEGNLSLALTEKLWAMGRYMSIASTRVGGKPCSLTGLWHGDYFARWPLNLMNINMPMIHWHLLDGNLAELMLPFFDLYDGVIEHGRANAKNLFGKQGIFLGSIITREKAGYMNVTAPHLTQFIAVNAWVAQHYYDYYLFTGDKQFLRDRALPLMEEAANFYKDYMVEAKDGFYDIYPDNSPENSPLNSNGEFIVPNHWCATHKNATLDYAAIKEMFTNLIVASKELNINANKINDWEEILTKLRPYQVNENGVVKEWMHDDFYECESHRHFSHVYPLMPGFEINKEDNQEDLLNAFINIADRRVKAGLEYHSGWSLMHLANVYARGSEAEKALQCLEWMAQSCLLDNLLSFHNDWRGGPITLNEEYGATFQTDGSMGWVSAVQEMLFTSRPGIVKLLPALPKKWKAGSLKNMKCRGQVDITSLSWDQDKGEIKCKLNSSVNQQVEVVAPRNYTPVISEENKMFVKKQSGKLLVTLSPVKLVSILYEKNN